MESLRTSDKAAARACRAADLQNLCHIISSYKLELKPIKAFPLGFQTRSGFLVVIRFFFPYGFRFQILVVRTTQVFLTLLEV